MLRSENRTKIYNYDYQRLKNVGGRISLRYPGIIIVLAVPTILFVIYFLNSRHNKFTVEKIEEKALEKIDQLKTIEIPNLNKIVNAAKVNVPVINQLFDIQNIEVPGWSRSTPRDTARYLKPNEKTAKLEPKIFNNTKSPLLVLIFVESRIENFESRQTVRRTWGNTTYFNYQLFEKFHGTQNGNYLDINNEGWKAYVETEAGNNDSTIEPKHSKFRIGLVFLLGIPANDPKGEIQSKLIDEHAKYGDLLQENFIDTYYNLTLKTMFMLKWINNNCLTKIKFAMKTDDDAFLNVPNLIHVLLGGTVPVYKSTALYYDKETIYATNEMNRIQNESTLFMGTKLCFHEKMTDPSDKAYTPNYLYNQSIFPEFFSGIGYAFGMDSAAALYNTSFKVPLLHVEDVYLTGLVAEKLKLKRTHCPIFMHFLVRNDCAARGLILQHRFSATSVQKIYDFVMNFENKCEQLERNFMLSNVKVTHLMGCHVNEGSE